MSDAQVLPGPEYPQVAQAAPLDENRPYPSNSLPKTVGDITYTDEERNKAENTIQQILENKLGVWDWNIGNVRYDAGIPWEGRGKPFCNGSSGLFETAISPEYGVRLNTKNLFAHVRRLAAGHDFEGQDQALPFTLQNLAYGWAPVRDHNDPIAWADGVSKWSGIDKNTVLDVTDRDLLIKIMRAINIVEKGYLTVPESAFADGVDMALNRMAAPKSLDQIRKDMAHIAINDLSLGPTKDNPSATELLPLVIYGLNKWFGEQDWETGGNVAGQNK